MSLREAALDFIREYKTRNQWLRDLNVSDRDLFDAAMLAYKYKPHEWEDGYNPRLNDAIEERFGVRHFRNRNNEQQLWAVVGEMVFDMIMHDMRN